MAANQICLHRQICKSPYKNHLVILYTGDFHEKYSQATTTWSSHVVKNHSTICVCHARALLDSAVWLESSRLSTTPLPEIKKTREIEVPRERKEETYNTDRQVFCTAANAAVCQCHCVHHTLPSLEFLLLSVLSSSGTGTTRREISWSSRAWTTPTSGASQ